MKTFKINKELVAVALGTEENKNQVFYALATVAIAIAVQVNTEKNFKVDKFAKALEDAQKLGERINNFTVNLEKTKQEMQKVGERIDNLVENTNKVAKEALELEKEEDILFGKVLGKTAILANEMELEGWYLTQSLEDLEDEMKKEEGKSIRQNALRKFRSQDIKNAKYDVYKGVGATLLGTASTVSLEVYLSVVPVATSIVVIVGSLVVLATIMNLQNTKNEVENAVRSI